MKKQKDYAFKDNVDPGFGPAGGTVTCDPSESQKKGTYDVTCTVTGNNGKKETVTFPVKHSYPAVWKSETCTRTVPKCESKCGSWVRDLGGGNWAACSGGAYCNCTWYYDDCSGTQTESYNCSRYTCPQGGTLSGDTCYYSN